MPSNQLLDFLRKRYSSLLLVCFLQIEMRLRDNYLDSIIAIASVVEC
jgi:hypothetical protein